MKAFARTAVVLGISVWGAAAMAGPNDYNGRWSVRLVTDSGVCDQSYSTVLSVQNGQVSGGGGESIAFFQPEFAGIADFYSAFHLCTNDGEQR